MARDIDTKVTMIRYLILVFGMGGHLEEADDCRDSVDILNVLEPMDIRHCSIEIPIII